MLLKFDRVVHETDEAILLDFAGKREWIAKGNTDWPDGEDTHEIDVDAWVAVDKGLEGFAI